MKAFYNTKERGRLNILIYKEKESEDYVAVCLNFDIVEHGKNPIELKKSIEEAALCHLEAVRKQNLSDDYLNICPEKKHLDKLREIEMITSIKPTLNKKKTASNQSDFFIDLAVRSYDSQNFVY